MAQLNLYVPNDLAASLKKEATEAHLSLSRYVLSLLSDRGPENKWPAGYFENVCGFLTEDMHEPADAPPEPVDDMDFHA